MSSSKQSFIENDFVEIWIENGIIMEVFKSDVTKVTLEAAKKIVQDRLKVSNRINRPIFIDMANARAIDKEARDFFAEGESLSYLTVAAILLNSYTAWLGGKLFLAFNKPVLKTELFKSKQKALEWLEEQM